MAPVEEVEVWDEVVVWEDSAPEVVDEAELVPEVLEGEELIVVGPEVAVDSAEAGDVICDMVRKLRQDV